MGAAAGLCPSQLDRVLALAQAATSLLKPVGPPTAPVAAPFFSRWVCPLAVPAQSAWLLETALARLVAPCFSQLDRRQCQPLETCLFLVVLLKAGWVEASHYLPALVSLVLVVT